MSDIRVVPTEPFKARLIVDVSYNLNGEAWPEVLSNLHKMCDHAMENGLLTGEMDAEVLDVKVQAVLQPKDDAHSVIQGYMQQRISDGSIRPDAFACRLAHYGLMDPHEFVDEVRHRMQMEGED